MRTEDGPVVKRLQRTEDGWQAYKPVPWRRWPADADVIGEVTWAARTF